MKYNLLFLLLFSSPLISAPGDSLVTLCFTGDVTFANHFEQHVQNRFDYPFKYLNVLRKADLAMVNLENPLTRFNRPRDKAFVFKARPEYVRVLQDGGIDIVNLANNHIYDYGPQGLFDTIGFLDKAQIAHVGAGPNMPAARRPVIRTVKNITVAFLGYYGLRPHSGCHPASKDSAGTALRFLPYIRKDIRKIRNRVDYVIVSFHWGIEKEHYPQEDQIYFAHKTIDYGADAVIGHHPHVLQGIERYKGKIIAYSLGNFIFGGNSRRYETSAVLELSLSRAPKAPIAARIIPIEIELWQPRIADKEQAEKVLQELREYSSKFQQSIF